MSDFIGVYEDIASDDYCDRMIDKFLDFKTGMTSCARVGELDNNGASNRKDTAFFFERHCPDLCEETNRILDLTLSKYMDEHPALAMYNFYSHEVKVQETPPKGGFHLWHSEKSPRGNDYARCLVWMIYLNDTEDGEGTTEFIEQGVKIQPKKGAIVLFPSDWTHTHRGNPVYNCTKYIATGWYYLA